MAIGILRYILLASAVTLSLAAPAMAQTAQSEPTLYRSIGNWRISMDPNLNNGCVAAVGDLMLGSSIYIGFDDDHGTLFLALTNERWKTVTEGTLYEHTVQIGDYPAMKLVGIGGRTPDGRARIWFSAIPALLWSQLTSGTALRIWYENTLVTNISLSGSSLVLATAVECEREGPQTASLPYAYLNPAPLANPYPMANPYPAADPPALKPNT
jgi:hypothetical protein